MEVENKNSSGGSGNQHIPATLRIGVTGHRELKDEDAIAASIQKILNQLDDWFSKKLKHTPHTYSVISPLAEGADRLVAKEVLAWNTSMEAGKPSLEAVLPLPEEDYLQDFKEQWSKDEFKELFNRKASVKMFQWAGSREMAYETAGHYVVDNCDVLIAIWNGEESKGPGGTAEILQYAKEIGRHIFWLNSENGQLQEEIKPQKNGCQYIESLKCLDKFDSERLSQIKARNSVEEMYSSLVKKAEACNISTDFLQQVKESILPWFVRADLLALHYQKLHNIVGSAIYCFSALAVIMVALYVIFFHGYPQLLLAEVALMTIIVLLLLFSYRYSWHRKWIDYRFLAERLRAAIFLRVLGIKLDRPEPPPYLSLSHRPDDWMIMAFCWVWNLVDFTPITFGPGLQSFLRIAWVEDQANWYRDSSRRLKGKHNRYLIFGDILFSLTLIVGVIHFGQILPSLSNSLAFMAVALPASGASVRGFLAQRDYRRNAERYRVMVVHLTGISNQIKQADDLKSFVDLLNRANEMMLREHQDWRVVVLFHKLEVPA